MAVEPVDAGSLEQRRGPDIALVGAARAGTSYLAAQLSQHPAVDGGVVKEPNYFSQHFERGEEWYGGLYRPRQEGLLRLDASMSYTSPTYPGALHRLAEAAPSTFVVYAVRDPLERALSHYRYLKHYLHRDEEKSFGSAVRRNEVYLGASDYAQWLARIFAAFQPERVLIAPLDVTTSGDQVTQVLWGQLGLASLPTRPRQASLHRNEVVEFRSAAIREVRRFVKRHDLYPLARRLVGPQGMRRLRGALTQPLAGQSVEEALASCDAPQRAELCALGRASHAAVRAALRAQDERLALDWSDSWPAPSWLGAG
jgi:hypothetical protein